MSKPAIVENIQVSRPSLLQGIEVLTGNAVTEPYPRHWHEEYQLCFLTAGDGYVNYRGQDYPTPTTSLYRISPGEIHSNHTDSSCSFCTVYLDSAALDRSSLFKEELDFADSLNPMISNPFVLKNFVRFNQALTGHPDSLEQQSALVELVMSLQKKSQQNSRYKEGTNENRLVGLIKDYLHENYQYRISLADLSDLTNLSPYHVNRLFSQKVGMPPHAFQIQIRIHRAKQLLRKGEPINSIAASLGFADQSHFTRHFKRLMKITPSLY